MICCKNPKSQFYPSLCVLWLRDRGSTLVKTPRTPQWQSNRYFLLCCSLCLHWFFDRWEAVCVFCVYLLGCCLHCLEMLFSLYYSAVIYYTLFLGSQSWLHSCVQRKKGMEWVRKNGEGKNLWFLFSVDEVVHFWGLFFKRRSSIGRLYCTTQNFQDIYFGNSKDSVC